GLSKILRELKAGTIDRKTVASKLFNYLMLRGALVIGASVAYELFNMGRPEYEELEEWEKDTYYHFWIGGKHVRIPKPFEVGALFSTLPQRLTRLIGGMDSGQAFRGHLATMVFE